MDAELIVVFCLRRNVSLERAKKLRNALAAFACGDFLLKCRGGAVWI